MFIESNKTKWKTLQLFVDGKARLTPDELASYYTDVVDDLSYAKTFYPKTEIEKYLNELASKAHRQIYVTKKEDRKRLWSFWTEEIPLAIRASHRELFIAFLVFACSIAIGVISSYIDPEFSRLILGDYYVDMTIANIEKGDPMGVYRDSNYTEMFYRIGSNNLQVGLLSFMFGVISSILAGFILLTNGVMVGAFQAFFVQRGLFWTSFSTIFIHGALELSAIVLIAGAGMIVGNSWWYPKTYSRAESLIMGGKRAIKILIAIIPIIVVAALLESYVTHLYQDLSDLVRFMIILLSFGYIAWYFIYYPIRVEQKLSKV